MGIFSIVVAVVAALISAGALLYTRRADRRAEKNEERLTAQEGRENRREQREKLAALLNQTAILHTEYLGVGKSGPRAYRFLVRNKGRQAASHVIAEFIDMNGNRVSAPSPLSGTAILDADESREIEVMVNPDALDRNQLTLQLAWWDTGPDRRSYLSKVEVPNR